MHSCQAPGPVLGPGQGPEPGRAQYSTLLETQNEGSGMTLHRDIFSGGLSV